MLDGVAVLPRAGRLPPRRNYLADRLRAKAKPAPGGPIYETIENPPSTMDPLDFARSTQEEFERYLAALNETRSALEGALAHNKVRIEEATERLDLIKQRIEGMTGQHAPVKEAQLRALKGKSHPGLK